MPALPMMEPPKVFAPESVSVPAPFFVMPLLKALPFATVPVMTICPVPVRLRVRPAVSALRFKSNAESTSLPVVPRP